MSATVYSLPTKDDLSKALSAFVEKESAAAIQQHGRFTVAVSGGSLPKLLSAELVNNSKVDFTKWHLFFADERCVALDHEDSNYLEVKKQLLDRLPEGNTIPSENIHTINPSLISHPEEAAEDYMDQLRAVFAARDSVRFPVFDLILLGMGPDGHTCSLFPGHPLLEEFTEWVASLTDSPKPPPNRITFTLPVVNHAHCVAFVTAGEGKQDMVSQILDTDGDLPSQRVKPTSGRLYWFVDDAASSKLKKQKTPFKL